MGDSSAPNEFRRLLLRFPHVGSEYSGSVNLKPFHVVSDAGNSVTILMMNQVIGRVLGVYKKGVNNIKQSCYDDATCTIDICQCYNKAAKALEVDVYVNSGGNIDKVYELLRQAYTDAIIWMAARSFQDSIVFATDMDRDGNLSTWGITADSAFLVAEGEKVVSMTTQCIDMQRMMDESVSKWRAETAEEYAEEALASPITEQDLMATWNTDVLWTEIDETSLPACLTSIL